MRLVQFYASHSISTILTVIFLPRMPLLPLVSLASSCIITARNNGLISYFYSRRTQYD